MKTPASVLTVLIAILSAGPALAQSVSTEGLSVGSTLTQLLTPVAAGPAAEAIAAATALEVNTAPFGTSSGGFVFKLDPSTGLRVRTAPTFGPSFAERALTAGEGKVTVAVSLIAASYDKLNKLPLKTMEVSSVTAPTPTVSRTGSASLVLSSETLVVSGAVGATDKLDIAVAVPFVKVKLDGISWVENGVGDLLLRANGAAESSGLGDLGVSVKLRLLSFGEGPPDPGGVAFLLASRLPTGNRENLRGLGITRVLGSVLFSAGKGKFRPHANGGFEWWEKGLTIVTGFRRESSVEARHMVQYVAGFEYEAGPKVTLLVDFLGRHVLGGGRTAEVAQDLPPGNPFGATSLSSVMALPEDIQKLALAPGLKWNLKGSFVLAFNTLIPVRDTGLYDRFTPVVGLDWTF